MSEFADGLPDYKPKLMPVANKTWTLPERNKELMVTQDRYFIDWGDINLYIPSKFNPISYVGPRITFKMLGYKRAGSCEIKNLRHEVHTWVHERRAEARFKDKIPAQEAKVDHARRQLSIAGAKFVAIRATLTNQEAKVIYAHNQLKAAVAKLMVMKGDPQ